MNPSLPPPNLQERRLETCSVTVPTISINSNVARVVGFVVFTNSGTAGAEAAAPLFFLSPILADIFDPEDFSAPLVDGVGLRRISSRRMMRESSEFASYTSSQRTRSLSDMGSESSMSKEAVVDVSATLTSRLSSE
eukprot:CAMPEP_0173057890 /NCGR_PEP_ID=MMETSP1102-20130122/1027_1 /TAXON_ID=49646 /ORGANISM="Geminigera sp., Strain Caron Lab Isolate" /LENGTH=135 /DNA_ID=CAMNT_0013923527 /DNA_START=784 /DNA_END=1191 /DNA_ORIENTATION=-